MIPGIRGRGSNNMRVYSNLSSRRDIKARRKAEYRAQLPKHPLQRFLYHFKPSRMYHYWFSRQGALMALKLVGVGFMILLIAVVAVFAYFRKDLDKFNPQELAARVHSSTTKYYDRTGKVLLWEDASAENRTVIQSGDISPYMKKATVALEDKDFYKNNGFSPEGIARAGFSHLTGGGGGGSTITQQLVKNVLLSDEQTISRKFKEVILSIEVERYYSKDQILTMYLNEVSYGGNRNGVEAASRSYFGKAAKDLTLDEAAFLAAIPQRPTDYNPQSATLDSKGLVARQHVTLDKMAQQGMISDADDSAAKKVNTLDKVLPPTNNLQNIIAPHFVLEVQQQLEEKYGAKLVTTGGLNVTTTLDVNAQKNADQSMQMGIGAVDKQGGNNAAMVAIQNSTGQILAYEGSRDFNYPGYGSYNAATSLLQPGSSVKVFDYSELFKPRSGTQYTPGSVLPDQSINIAGYQPHDFDNRYRGNISIRQALAESRNIPAVKAAYIAGMNNVVDLAHQMGDKSYCTTDSNGYCGLAAAIGGYGLHLDEHTNAYATLARGGVYKPLAYVLKVKGPNGDTLQEWKDTTGTQVLDPQIPYMISDMLADANARVPTFGSVRSQTGFNPAGVKAAVKTGTTDNSTNGWMMGYSTAVTLGVWAGRNDGGQMLYHGQPAVTHEQTGPMFGNFLANFHKDEGAQYGWKTGDWFAQPAGIHRVTVDGHNDLAPSWYKSDQGNGTKITMDSVSKKKATSCTPARARQDITVYPSTDPITKKQTFSGVPDGFNTDADDDVHHCDDAKPTVTLTADTAGGKITAMVTQGKNPMQSLEIQVGGKSISSQNISGSGTYVVPYTFTGSGSVAVTAIVVDQALYDATTQQNFNVIAAPAAGAPDH
jgi:penicillin-binding protein 1A